MIVFRTAALLCWLLLLGVFQQANSSCQGDSCPEEHEEAVAAGLLGSTSNSCPDKKYPVGGKLKPTTFPTPILDLRWAGIGADVDKYVFALTRGADGLVGGRLYRSDYYGKEGMWKDVTSFLPGALPVNSSEPEGVVDLHFHADHPQRILFQGPGQHHWVTEDYGATYKAIPTPSNTLGYGASIKIHPTRPDWVLSRVRRNECLHGQGAISKWCAFDLFVSKDFGSSWANLTANSKGAVASFWDFDWGAEVSRSQHTPYPDETILATVYESASAMKGPYPGWDKDIHFVVSHDLFTTAHRKLVPCGNQFEVLGSQIYLAMPSDCPVAPDGSKRPASKKSPTGAQTVSLYVSNDEGETFLQACIPINYMDQGYNLVHTQGGTGVFVVVDHDEEDQLQARAPISNIYAPGYNPTLFTLSMRRNFRRGYVTDFARVEAMPGIFLANQLDGKIFVDPTLIPPHASYTDYVQTKISFNGGAHWQDLPLPQSFAHAECNACNGAKNCKLHLHGPSSWHYGADARPSFYTHAAAPGVIMGTGNVGEYLNFQADVTCTWLSVDGGATWRDVAPTAAIYEFGDHGGILVMASHQTEAPAQTVSFSLDQGGCWYTVELEEAINVQNIRVEPKGASDTFVIHGQACVKSAARPSCSHTDPAKQPGGRLYTVDITDLMGADLPKCRAGDYEDWWPATPSGCLLGQNYTMQRRKAASLCFNDLDYRQRNTTNKCECGAQDLECEFGFEASPNGDCQPVPGMGDKTCPAISQKKYYVSETHKRLVHEDQCQDVGRVIPDSDGMGTATGGGGGGGGGSGGGGKQKQGGMGGVAEFFVSVLVLGVVVAAFGVWWSQFASDEARGRVEEVVAPVAGFCLSGVGWAKEKVMGLSARREAHDAFFQPLAGGEGLHLDSWEDARSPPVFPGM